MVDGKVMVPPGNYRLYACNLAGKGAPGDQVMVSGIQRIPQTPVSIVAGKANICNCGGPLEIRVTAAKVRGTARGLPAEDAGDATDNSEYTLRINANVAGAGGEIYSISRRATASDPGPPNPRSR